MFVRRGLLRQRDFVNFSTKRCIITSQVLLAKDYYSILKVPKTATAKDIKSAYLTLAKKYHPDRNRQDANATKIFHDISEAYDVLGNADKRRNYDLNGQYGDNPFQSNRNPHSHNQSHHHQWYSNPGQQGSQYHTQWKFTSNMDGKTAEDIFKQMFKEMEKAQASGQFNSFSRGQRDGSAPFNTMAQEIGKKIMEEMMKSQPQGKKQSSFFQDVFKYMKMK